MFSRNLKYYRLKNGLSKKELAEKAGVSAMSITYYESGDRKPGMETMKTLADALNIRVSDFLAVNSQNITFSHGEFRKNASLSNYKQAYIRESAEEYFNRFMTVVDILGGNILPDAPACRALAFSGDTEKDASALRKHLNFSPEGPVDDLIGKLENRGVLVCECDIDSPKFSGMNGFVNGRPYIVFNPHMTAERNRSTIAHELAHLMFVWPENTDETEVEKTATAISGAFLFPKADAIRELGFHRSSISGDMLMTAAKYGISMMLLAKRAEICHIISKARAKDFYIRASAYGWRTAEPSRIASERPTLFQQLVYRAVNEDEISAQRGAELLKTSYDHVMARCHFSEV